MSVLMSRRRREANLEGSFEGDAMPPPLTTSSSRIKASSMHPARPLTPLDILEALGRNIQPRRVARAVDDATHVLGEVRACVIWHVVSGIGPGAEALDVTVVAAGGDCGRVKKSRGYERQSVLLAEHAVQQRVQTVQSFCSCRRKL